MIGLFQSKWKKALKKLDKVSLTLMVIAMSTIMILGTFLLFIHMQNPQMSKQRNLQADDAPQPPSLGPPPPCAAAIPIQLPVLVSLPPPMQSMYGEASLRAATPQPPSPPVFDHPSTPQIHSNGDDSASHPVAVKPKPLCRVWSDPGFTVSWDAGDHAAQSPKNDETPLLSDEESPSICADPPDLIAAHDDGDIGDSFLPEARGQDQMPSMSPHFPAASSRPSPPLAPFVTDEIPFPAMFTVVFTVIGDKMHYVKMEQYPVDERLERIFVEDWFTTPPARNDYGGRSRLKRAMELSLRVFKNGPKKKYHCTWEVRKIGIQFTCKQGHAAEGRPPLLPKEPLFKAVFTMDAEPVQRAKESHGAQQIIITVRYEKDAAYRVPQEFEAIFESDDFTTGRYQSGSKRLMPMQYIQRKLEINLRNAPSTADERYVCELTGSPTGVSDQYLAIFYKVPKDIKIDPQLIESRIDSNSKAIHIGTILFEKGEEEGYKIVDESVDGHWWLLENRKWVRKDSLIRDKWRYQNE